MDRVIFYEYLDTDYIYVLPIFLEMKKFDDILIGRKMTGPIQGQSVRHWIHVMDEYREVRRHANTSSQYNLPELPTLCWLSGNP